MPAVKVRCEAWVNSSASTVRSGPTFSSQSITWKTGSLLWFAGIAQQASLTGVYWLLVVTNRMKLLKLLGFHRCWPTVNVASRPFEFSSASKTRP